MKASAICRLGTTVSCVALTAFFQAGPALAQNVPSPPVRQPVDENGVDTSNGTFNVTTTDVSVGEGEGAMAYVRSHNGDGWRDNLTGSLTSNGTTMTASIGDSSSTFTISGTTYTSDQADGSILTFAAPAQEYTYVTDNGTTAIFAASNGAYTPYGNAGYLRSITRPNGTTITINNVTGQFCPAGQGSGSACAVAQTSAVRVQSATSSTGYQLKLEFASNALADAAGLSDWYQVTKVVGINNAVENCNPTAPTCTLTGNWPQMAYSVSGNTETETNSAGGQHVFTYDAAGRILTIKRPAATTASTTITYGGSDSRVWSVTNEGVTYNYAWSQSYPFQTMTRTSPSGAAFLVDTHTPTGAVTRETLPTGSFVAYSHDSNFRISTVSWSWGAGYRLYTYDPRGNVTETRLVSNAPATQPDIVTTAYYDPACANPVICNKPIWTRDPAGNQTDYTYDPVHGGVLTVTGPAATAGDVRPQTRNTYSTFQAYYRNNSGAIVASGVPTYLLTAASACQTTASCTGSSDEAKTAIGYGPQVAGSPNNLLPVAVSKGSGNGTLTATIGLAYDAVGNLTYVDGPLAGGGDTTRYLFDALRRPIGSIAPTVGSQPNLAQATTYNPDGAVTRVDSGTTAGQSDAAWTGITIARSVTNSYDANGRRTRVRLSAGGLTYSISNFSYDASGRLDCSALRMNPAAYGGSIPASACTASTVGAFGPDRIVKLSYDPASRVIAVTTGFGTADAVTETQGYTGSGKIAFVTDGKGNTTTYAYDGFDRASQTRMPWPMVGITGSSSNTDYQTYTYDNVGNLIDLRLRDGQVLHFSYDLIGRPTQKQSWSQANGYYETTGYSYDLFGRMASATGTHPVMFTFDALGRTTGTTLNGIAKQMEYNIGGRMTKLTWQDGFYINYDYDVLGRVIAIRENGATTGVGVLASYNYDSLGRRSTVTYGNGASRGYAWDGLNRLTGLKVDLAGTANDQIIGAYGGTGTALAYNPASQISSLTRSNNAYAWTAQVNVTRTYTQNGLNQYGAAGAVSFGYDARGNLNQSGSQSWTYSADNQLLTDSASGASLSYDRIGRLYRVNQAGGFYSFDYAGSILVAELGGSNQILRRYVPGPGTDEPVVWYQGSGTNDRRFLQADERGSIVSVADSVGGSIAINRYDPFGIPQSGNLGRFQFTGQTWLAELGLYNYKARMYSPTLGRFMQSDPIGYGDGLNWYDYVHGDPVNRSDPSGLCDVGQGGRLNGCVKPINPNEIVVNGSRRNCLACEGGDIRDGNIGLENMGPVSPGLGGRGFEWSGGGDGEAGNTPVQAKQNQKPTRGRQNTEDMQFKSVVVILSGIACGGGLLSTVGAGAVTGGAGAVPVATVLNVVGTCGIFAASIWDFHRSKNGGN